MYAGWAPILYLLIHLCEQIGGAPPLRVEPPPLPVAAEEQQPQAPAANVRHGARGGRKARGNASAAEAPMAPPAASEIGPPATNPPGSAPNALQPEPQLAPHLEPQLPPPAEPQLAPPAAPRAEHQVNPQMGNPLVPVDQQQNPTLAGILRPQLVAAAATLGGRGISLVDALAAEANPTARLDIVRVYWRLACAMLDFQFRQSESKLLEQLAAPVGASAAEPPAELAAAQAAALARQQEARITVMEAQQQLAALARMGGESQLLVATDLPHSGSYRTKFDILFSGRSAPPQVILLNRILPLRYAEVDARGQAVQAAEQAVAASHEAATRDPASLRQLLTDVSQLASVRRTLVDSLRQYNEEIADYAWSVVAMPADAPSVAAMLIKPPTGQPLADDKPAATGQGVERAIFQAPRRSSDGEHPTQINQPSSDLPPSATGSQAEPSAADRQDQLPVAELSQLFTDTQLYRGLVGMEPNARTRRLAAYLYQPPATVVQESPLTLTELLAASGGRPQIRREIIVGFWRAAELAARCAVLDDVRTQIESIAAALQQNPPAQPSSALAIAAAGEAAHADAVAARVELTIAQWQLTVALNRQLDQSWIMPATAPQATPYRPTPGKDGLATPDNRLAAIDQWHALLVDQAAAIVDLDRFRSATLSAAASGDNMYQALAAIGQEAEETLSFLSAITRYNQQIADYALALLPSDTPPALIASALVSDDSGTSHDRG